MILGLTGGIGSGKSTVSGIFKNIGIEIFDADLIAKEIFEEEKTQNEIKKVFGEEILTSNRVDREKLKEKVFNDKKKLENLNKIIHPKVIERYRNIKERVEEKLIIFDVPLLFESGIDKLCDKILVVDIDEELQRERVKKRDGISSELVEKIIKSQLPREERIKKADFVVENNGSLEDLKEKVLNLVKELGSR